MAFKSFRGGSVQIEVVPGGSVVAGAYDLNFTTALQVLCEHVGQSFGRLDEASRPSDFEVRFALAALENGGYAVALDGNRSSFQITMSWGKDQSEEPSMPSVPSLP